MTDYNKGDENGLLSHTDADEEFVDAMFDFEFEDVPEDPWPDDDRWL